MKFAMIAGAAALVVAAMPSAAFADDPKDPRMRDKAARDADAAEIRRLNREQLRYVQQRDARYAKGWQATRDYPRVMAEHERKMAEWRHAVKMGDSGHHEYCAR